MWNALAGVRFVRGNAWWTNRRDRSGTELKALRQYPRFRQIYRIFDDGEYNENIAVAMKARGHRCQIAARRTGFTKKSGLHVCGAGHERVAFPAAGGETRAG